MKSYEPSKEEFVWVEYSAILPKHVIVWTDKTKTARTVLQILSE